MLHLRRSKDNICDEAFGERDIDYQAVAKHLLEINVRARQAQQSR